MNNLILIKTIIIIAIAINHAKTIQKTSLMCFSFATFTSLSNDVAIVMTTDSRNYIPRHLTPFNETIPA
jgi:hypothetical protein